MFFYMFYTMTCFHWTGRQDTNLYCVVPIKVITVIHFEFDHIQDAAAMFAYESTHLTL